MWSDWKKEEKGELLKDAVYGASDGIVTTFAIVAGVSGASLNPSIVLIMGFANLIGDGFSMASGNYLGTKSEQEYYASEKKRILLDLKKNQKKYTSELRKIFEKKGFSGKLLDDTVSKIKMNRSAWVKMILENKEGFSDKNVNAMKSALTTFGAFVVAGLMPLVAYVLSQSLGVFKNNTFEISIFITAITLLTVGILKASVTKKPWVTEALQMLFVGGFAAVVAYYIGYVVSLLV